MRELNLLDDPIKVGHDKIRSLMRLVVSDENFVVNGHKEVRTLTL